MESNGTRTLEQNEERLFRGAEVATIYGLFQQVPLVEFSCVAFREDERTGNDSKIENFRFVFLIQSSKGKWHQYGIVYNYYPTRDGGSI